MNRFAPARRAASACAVFLVALAWAQAEPAPKPLLWKIDGKKPSYLFGTIHLTRPSVTNLPASVTNASSGADAVYTEIPADLATMMSLTPKMFLPDGGKLSDVVPAEMMKQLQVEFTAINPGLSLQPFERFKPWAIAATLMALGDQMKYPGALALDMLLFQKAAIAGKETGGLETPDEQFAVFDGFSNEEQVEMLKDTVEFMRESREKGLSPTDDLVNAYLSDDLDQVDAELKKWDASSSDPELEARLMDRLLYQRNERMAERIAKRLHDNPDTSYFFAIGAAHLGGDRGVIALLEKAGFKLTRVE